jgi:bacterial/archaeal transporter family-2 protein
MVYIIVAILAGVSIVISRIINSNLANKIGIFQGTFFNYIVGLFFSFIFLFISSESMNISSRSFHEIPLWAYLGGLTGVIVVALSNFITPKISAFYLTLIIFIGQLFVGILLDYFSTNTLSPGKLLGGLLVLIGLAYNLYIDYKKVTNAHTNSVSNI